MPVRSGALWDGQALRLTLDAPPGNVLDLAMLRELGESIDRGVDARTKLVVLEGAGAHFSYGAAVGDHVHDRAPTMLRAFHAIFLRLIDLAVPTAAVVRGRCLGGAAELVAFCHFAFAHPDATLAFPEIKLAVFPPIASVVLPWKIGQGRADELILTGASIDAAQALAIGLVGSVGEDPWAQLEIFARREILPKSAVALRHGVRAARLGFHEALRRQLPTLEAAYLDELMATPDANEGIAAFLEKRAPRWSA
ncbi:MAG: enoyl-CoA hydratase/isomerase family protein [Myxococcota bacterium]